MRRQYRYSLWGSLAALSGVACSDGNWLADWWGRRQPAELPALITMELPFRYPPGLYMQGIQDDVTLRLFIDSLGRVDPESTSVAEPAKRELFNAAAIEGASQLEFRPARRGERRIGYTVLFPVKFRVPNGPPLPQDTAQPGKK